MPRISVARTSSGFHGFGDEVVDRAVVDRVGERRGVAVRGDHDPDRLRVDRGRAREELGARHAGHAVIGDHHRHRLGVDDLEPLLAARRGEDRELAPERELEDPQVLGLVVDVEDRILAQLAEHLGVRPHRAPRPAHPAPGSAAPRACPRRGSDSSSSRPPCSSTIRRLIESPSPEPRPTLVVTNGSNRRSRTSGATPGPSSRISTSTAPSSARAVTQTAPAPLSNDSAAFLSRLRKTWLSARDIAADLRQPLRDVGMDLNPGRHQGVAHQAQGGPQPARHVHGPLVARARRREVAQVAHQAPRCARALP